MQNLKERGKNMKKVVGVLLLSAVLVVSLTGCGGSSKLKQGKPYSIKNSDSKCDITILNAERTSLLSEFNGDTENDIIYINCSINLKSSDEDAFLTAYDFEENVRVKDDNGTVLDYFEYALPGEDKTVIELEKGENVECSFPVVVPSEEKRLTVDVFDGEDYSNELTLVIE